MATPSRRANPEAQLRGFIAKFGPADQRRIRAVRMALRKRLPTANELVWDNYNFFVIGYSPTDRPTDAALSMAARAGGRFLWIRNLADPNVMLAIVATALTVLATGAGAASAQNRTLMLAISAAIAFVVLSKMSAGVALYWTMSSVFGSAQGWIARRPRRAQAV